MRSAEWAASILSCYLKGLIHPSSKLICSSNWTLHRYSDQYQSCTSQICWHILSSNIWQMYYFFLSRIKIKFLVNPFSNWTRNFWMCPQRYSNVINYLNSNFMVTWCLCVSNLKYWNISVKWITGNQRTHFIVHDIQSWRMYKSTASIKEYQIKKYIKTIPYKKWWNVWMSSRHFSKVLTQQ